MTLMHATLILSNKHYLSTFITLILAFLHYSCSQQEENEAEKFILEESSKILSFPIDSTTINESMCLSYFDNRLYYLNDLNNELQVYNTEKQQREHAFVFPLEGPEATGRISGFKILNQDSMLLFPINNPSFTFVDLKNGSIIDQVNYQQMDGYSEAYVVSSLHSIPHLHDNKLYFKSLFDGNLRTLSSKELMRKYLIMEYDVQTTNTQAFPFTYPERLWESGKKEIHWSFAGHSNSLVLSFFVDHHLYSLDLNSKQVREKKAQSAYFKDRFETIPINGSRMEMLGYFSTSQQYKSVVYDPFQKKYYRFCMPAVEVESEEDLLHYRRYPKAFSVMILDENLEYLGESLITEDNKEYYPDNFFIKEDGLYIMLNNPKLADGQENEIRFKRFELKAI